MSGKNRRNSLDDFKEGSFTRPLIKPKPQKQVFAPPPAPPKQPVAENASVENLPRNCAICNMALTEARYAEHFAACMKQRAAKAAAAAKAAKAIGGNVRPITDFISVKPSPSSNKSSVPKPEDQPSTSTSTSSASATTSSLLDATGVVLPYCPVCGRVIKTDRSYAPHLKQCAKKYNVAPDLLLELSKKQMTLQVEIPSSKPLPGKKRPANFFEIPSSMEDEQLQLAVALSASVIETHGSHLPIVSIAENAPPKRLKRQTSIDLTTATLRDPADGQIRLLELINERFSNEPKNNNEKKTASENASRLFHLACSSPGTVFGSIKSSDALFEMPSEFHIETCYFDLAIDISDKSVQKNVSPEKKNLKTDSENSQQTGINETTLVSTSDFAIQDSTLQIASNFDRDVGLITSTLAPSVVTSDESSQTEDVFPAESQSNDRLASNMLRLLNNKETTDIHFLSSDGSLIGAHRLILFAHCPGLISQRELTDDKTTITAPRNRLSSYTFDFICSFFEFVYAGKRHPTFQAEIETLFQSLQGGSCLESNVESEKEKEDANFMSDSAIFAIADDVSPQQRDDKPFFQSSELVASRTETPALPPRSPSSPIILSSPSPVDVYYDASSTSGTGPGVESPLSGELPPISPEKIAEKEEKNAIVNPISPVIELSPPPPPPLGDEWMDFDNPNFNDCCFTSELPLSQQQIITQEENDLIADFDHMRKEEKEEVLVVPSVDSDPDLITVSAPVVAPSKLKLTAAGKARPRVSIVGLTSVAPQSKRDGIKKGQTPVTPATHPHPQRTTPSFSQMATPNLAKLLSKYGVRKLPKKHMVLKLKEIHSVLKPKQETVAETRPEAPTISTQPGGKKPELMKKPVHWKARGKYQFSSSSSSSEQEENQEDEDEDGDEAEVTLEPNALSLLDDIADEDDEGDGEDEVAVFFSQSQTASQAVAKRVKKAPKVPKIVATGEEFAEKVAAFIRSDRELYSDLLQFKPLPFKDIYTKVRKVGNFACSKQQLVDFLDEQCITFRLAPGKSHRPPPPPPVEKKPKQSKKQQASSAS